MKGSLELVPNEFHRNKQRLHETILETISAPYIENTDLVK
jgi:hypothetical protein